MLLKQMNNKLPALKYGLLFLFVLLLAGCSQKKQWAHKDTISLQEQVHPLGIAENEGAIWISAPDQKKLIQINEKGEVLNQQTGLERPMHIDAAAGKLFAPLYLEDQVVTIQNGITDTLSIGIEPDAPAAVSVKGDTVAIADFYNHRIILQSRSQTTTFGEKGSGKGQLNYPTDVEISGDKIYVADAYNNRVQVFDTSGKPLQVIGEKDSINVATGLTVHKGQLFVADFYNNRILVYNLSGNLTQTLSGHFDKPTDIRAIGVDLYIPNYGSYSIVRYTLN